MSKSTISTFQLFEMFPDQESARSYLESQLWPNGPRCLVCGLGERITTRKGGFYRCNQCKEDFTVRTGTIFERSHVPLHKWLYAMYLVVRQIESGTRCDAVVSHLCRKLRGSSLFEPLRAFAETATTRASHGPGRGAVW